MRIWTLGLIILAFSAEVAAATATDSLVSGHAISNTYMDYVKIDCPKGDICMDVWFRWTIDVEKTVDGPRVEGRIIAVRLQHTTVTGSYESRLRFFVLRPIQDPKWRALLRADYYLISTSLPERITEVHLTVLSSGICSVDRHKMNCSDISRYLRSRDIRHGCHILIGLNSRARYADVAAAVKSLQDAGGLCKIGSIAVK